MLSFSLISVAMGLVECNGNFFVVDSDVGNVIGDSCPLRPLWVSRDAIHLPMQGVSAAQKDRGDGADAQCLAWLGGAMAALGCLLHVVLKAASEDWQIRMLCMLG